MILNLTSTEANLSAAGGKGANLAVLVRAGFNVPPGFIITTAAYQAFVRANLIEEQVLEMAGRASTDDSDALETVSQDIRTLFNSGTLPSELAADIRRAYSELGAGNEQSIPVAVRSSATAEDLPGMSFAGQQDTYLNVIGPEAVLQAVKACWGSLWTARAMAYRARNGITPSEVFLAVVVQQMISSDVSGVVFTANPLTGHRGEMVIDASFGLGEAIVSGQVDPDHYVVDRRIMQIVLRRLGAKVLAIRPRVAGGTEAVTGEEKESQALPDTQILDLAGTSGRVEELFGSPQDIEWAWAGGRLYILQSRPITSLYPVPDSLLQSATLRVLFSFNSVQGFLEPFTPLGRDFFPMILGGLLKSLGVRRSVQEIIVIAGGRLFVDITVPVGDRRLRRVILTALANIEPGARRAVIQLIETGRVSTAQLVRRRELLRVAAGFWPVLARMALAWILPLTVRRRAVARAGRLVEQVRQTISSATNLQALLSVIDKNIPETLPRLVFKTIVPAMGPGMAAQQFVDRWLTRWAGVEEGAMRRLLRGLPGNPTTEMDLSLWAVAQSIRSDPQAADFFQRQPAEIARAYQSGEMPAAARDALSVFLERYGMRAVGEIDAGRPRWREDPRSLVQNLASYLEIKAPEAAPDRQFQAAAVEAERLAAEYIALARKGKGRLRSLVLAFFIRRMRLLSGLREMPKFCIIQILDSMRTAFLAQGELLVQQGRLGRADDIFFIPIERLRALAVGEAFDLRTIAAGERAGYDREMGRKQIPRLLLSTGEVFYSGITEDGTGGLAGDGVSPGVVEGRVRVVYDPRGVRLEPGEILVCPATDPGWTPLFLSAGGLVMEMGGMITHGSVVAREYGIPAVAGVHEATSRLRTGQLVRVDGSDGRVMILDGDPTSKG